MSDQDPQVILPKTADWIKKHFEAKEQANPDPLEAEIGRRKEGEAELATQKAVSASMAAKSREDWLQYQAKAIQNSIPRPYLDAYQLQDWAESRFQGLEDRLVIVEWWLWLAVTACLVLIVAVVWLLWRAL